MRCFLPLLVLTTACTGGPPSDDPDTDTDPVVVDGCVGEVPEVEFARDVTTGQQPVGHAIDYGRPPQGGAPYAPFQVRLHADYDLTQRIEVSADAVEVSTGASIGSASQPQVFLCSNTGPHAGWLFGSEVHVRFWEEPLEELAGREIEVTMTVHLPEGPEVSSTTSGVLVWTLGLEDEAPGD